MLGRLRPRSVVLACIATAVVHLFSLSRQLGPDEGGFDMVARFWNHGGGYLYGPSWVDRPPGLIAVFALARLLGPYGVRLVATAVAVVLVAAVAWGANVIGGRTSARWAAWTAFGLASSVFLQAQRLNGELLAAALVALSLGALLHALRAAATDRQAAWFGVAAGVAATGAVLVKQNFVDGFVFAAVLCGLGLATAHNRLTYRPVRVVAAAGGLLVGASVVAATAMVWAQAHGGVGAMLFAMFGFRGRALSVIAHWSLAAPSKRLGHLVELGAVSGVLLLLAHLAFRNRRRLRGPEPLPWALAVTAAVEVAGVLGGANFWVHYLIALIPTVALGAGLAVHARMPGWGVTRVLVAAVVALTVLTSPAAALRAAATPDTAYTTGTWVGTSAVPADTVVVTYSHANVVAATGLRPGYPYAWSLPTRTLDPRLHLLTSDLDARLVGAAPNGRVAAPTWVVQWDAPDTWGLDPHGHVQSALQGHYHLVAMLCGHAVWLHRGLDRTLAPLPGPTACGPENE